MPDARWKSCAGSWEVDGVDLVDCDCFLLPAPTSLRGEAAELEGATPEGT